MATLISKEQYRLLEQHRKAKLLKENKRLKEQGLFGTVVDPKKTGNKIPTYTYPPRNTHLTITSYMGHGHNTGRKELRNRYTGEMYEREQKALKELEHRKHSVVPAYNKGPLIPISTKQQARDAGKKNA